MGISRFSLYKYVRIDGNWRYCKAAYHDNNKIHPEVVFVNGKEGVIHARVLDIVSQLRSPLSCDHLATA